MTRFLVAFGALSTGLVGALAPRADAMEGMQDSTGAAGEHGGEAHGDHRPKQGGRVLMYGDLHFEIVVRPEGGVELHLSDAMRNELPAVTVTDVTVELEGAGGDFETVDMRVNPTGGFWRGESAPLEDPSATTLHIAFVAFGEAITYALPVSALQPAATSAAVE